MKHALTPTLSHLLLIGVLAIAAGSGLVTADAAAAEDTAGNVARGAISWGQNCARCHEMRSPTEFRDDLWRPIVTHMRVRAGLTGQQQRDILAFLQASNNPQPLLASISSEGETTAASELSGKAVYDQTCVACHGPDGAGVLPGVPDFTSTNGPLAKPDDILIQHITEGFQTPGSPMAMPAKGGNPNLNAADVRSVLGYLRERFGK